MTQYTYEVQVVRNLGNYETIRVTEGMVESARADEKPDELRARVQGQVDEWIESTIGNIEAEIRGLKQEFDSMELAKARKKNGK